MEQDARLVCLFLPRLLVQRQRGAWTSPSALSHPHKMPLIMATRAHSWSTSMFGLNGCRLELVEGQTPQLFTMSSRKKSMTWLFKDYMVAPRWSSYLRRPFTCLISGRFLDLARATGELEHRRDLNKKSSALLKMVMEDLELPVCDSTQDLTEHSLDNTDLQHMSSDLVAQAEQTMTRHMIKRWTKLWKK